MEIQIRLARESDIQFIQEISQGIYDGHDYFPRVFLRWLHDANRGILVAENESATIIGLRAFHIVDGGRTVVSQSLRVHPEYRGKGVSALLIQAAQKYVETHFASVQTERYTTMSSNVPRLAIQRKSGSDSPILELALIAFNVHPANATAASEHGLRCSKSTNIEVEAEFIIAPLSHDGFRDLLEGDKLDSVAWKNTLIVDWQPYQAHPSNMSNGLIMDGDCLLASAKSDAIESLSHGRWSPRVKCRHWVATIYTLDEGLVRAHVTKQLERAILEIAPQESVIFSCFLATSLGSCTKDFIAKEFSLTYDDYFNFNLLLFEKNVAR